MSDARPAAVDPPAAARDAAVPGSFGVAGPPGAPAIVFLHGTRLSRGMWAAQSSDLADVYRVIVVDLPGHGTMAGVPFTVTGARDHVAAVIAAAGGGPAVLVGLSLGGYVAMEVAAARPDLVRGLVLSGATAEPVGALALPYRALAWALEWFDGPALDALQARFFRARYPASIADPIVAGGFWSAGGADAVRALVGRRFAPSLAAYPGPSLILNGEFDLLFRLEAGSFVRAARDARRVRLRGATHLANLDRPAAFSLAIRRFADAVTAASPALAARDPDRSSTSPVVD